MIDRREAQAALADINDMVARVRQSRIYDIASQIMIVCGRDGVRRQYRDLCRAALWLLHLARHQRARRRRRGRPQRVDYRRTGVRAFDCRVLTTFLLFFAFGMLCSLVLGHFGSREMGTFWPIYFMLFYCIAGLWFGRAFLAIGLGVTVLTLIGYFFITGAAFLLWMAMVNGGGLILSGLWMRWGE